MLAGVGGSRGQWSDGEWSQFVIGVPEKRKKSSVKVCISTKKICILYFGLPLNMKKVQYQLCIVLF